MWEVHFSVFSRASVLVPLQRHLLSENVLSLKAPWPFSLSYPSQVNFSDDSDLEDPVEAQLAEGPKRRGTASRGQDSGQARKGRSLKTGVVAASGGRSRRAKKVASGYCEELGPEIMRTIPEEELTDNQMEMSFEILRGSDGEDSGSGRTAGVGGGGAYVWGRLPWDRSAGNN